VTPIAGTPCPTPGARSHESGLARLLPAPDGSLPDMPYPTTECERQRCPLPRARPSPLSLRHAAADDAPFARRHDCVPGLRRLTGESAIRNICSTSRLVKSQGLLRSLFGWTVAPFCYHGPLTLLLQPSPPLALRGGFTISFRISALTRCPFPGPTTSCFVLSTARAALS